MRTNIAPNDVEKPRKGTKKPSGYVIHQTDEIVVIATGFARKSANPKTGDMVQIWILPRNINPVEAVKTGQNRIVCLDCPHAGVMGQDGVNRDVTCYVRVPNAPLSIWRGYERGIYPVLDFASFSDWSLFCDLIAGRMVRFGAWGEPVLIPIGIVQGIAMVAKGWTGYTHQWSKPAYAQYREFLMASVDTVGQFLAAKRDGWRTFRIRGSEQAPLMTREIVCPASPEGGHKSECAKCKLCNGATAMDKRADIAIIVHGAGASKFIQIGGAL